MVSHLYIYNGRQVTPLQINVRLAVACGVLDRDMHPYASHSDVEPSKHSKKTWSGKDASSPRWSLAFDLLCVAAGLHSCSQSSRPNGMPRAGTQEPTQDTLLPEVWDCISPCLYDWRLYQPRFLVRGSLCGSY